MPETTGHTWACPSCGRRVPLRAEQCHCGMTRARAEELQAARPAAAARAVRPRRGTSDRQEALAAMTGDVKLLLAVTGLVLVAGLVWLAFGPRPKPVPPVLGYVDAGPPKIVQKTEPVVPPFKLPWWK
jgi:hypothetical protein